MNLRIALTFDAEHPDRPHCPPGNAASILDTLAATGTRATFFVQGRWAEAYPALARRIAAEGHLVGSHSFYHARLPLLTDAGLEEDIREAEAKIAATTGVNPRPWFRCPFGAGAEDPRVLSTLDRLGYRQVGYDVVPEDWEPKRSADQVRRTVVQEGLARGDGAVVLLHTWPAPTAHALSGIVEGLRAGGAELVRIDELPIVPSSVSS